MTGGGGALSPTLPPAFLGNCFVDFCHSDLGEMNSQSFALNFPNCWGQWTFFETFLSFFFFLLNSLFSFKNFLFRSQPPTPPHLMNPFDSLLLSSLFNCNINLVPDLWLTKILPHSVGFLFTQVVVSLAVESFLVLCPTCQLLALILGQMESSLESFPAPLSCRALPCFLLAGSG